MATPIEFTDQQLHDAGHTWFSAVGPVPADQALSEKQKADRDLIVGALKKRGYYRPIPGAKKDEATQAVLGEKLYREFTAARTTRSDATTGVVAESGTREEKAAALRAWMREQHGVALAVKRDENPPALARVPPLGELGLDSALSESSDALVKYLGQSEVLAVLSHYGIDEEEVARGAELRQGWMGAGVAVTAGRGQRESATADHVAARERFASWLNKWWGILKAKFPGRDGLLKTVGIEVGAIGRPARKGGESEPTDQPAKP